MPDTTTTGPVRMAAGLRSIEAEQSVLGCLLTDAAHWPDVAAIIGADAFSHHPYRAVFSAISELVAARCEVDVMTVHERLRLAGRSEDCGGLVHLNELAMSVIGAGSAARHAGIVADRAKRRALLAALDGASEVVLGAESADAALDALQAKLGNLQRASLRVAPRRIGEFAAKRIAHVQAVHEGTESPGMPTHLSKLDEALGGGLKPGNVVVLAARPSVGKTSLALQILLALGADGSPGLMLSQEMTGTELAGRALAHLGSIRMDGLASGSLDDREWGALTEQGEALSALPVWVDDQPALRLVDIAAKAREVQRAAGGRLGLMVIDYLQLCAAEAQGRGAANTSRHHQIEAISRGVKALAKELGCAVLLLSQLNRSAEDGEPELWHLKESGAVEEDADVVLLLHPVGMHSGALTVCCKVAKNRGGRRGRLALAFSGRVQQWDSSNADVSRKGRGTGSSAGEGSE